MIDNIVGSAEGSKKNDNGTYTMTNVKLLFENGKEIVVDSIILYPQGFSESANNGDKISEGALKEAYHGFASCTKGDEE